MRREFSICLSLGVFIASTSSVLACGFCNGDKAAAVYSYEDQKMAQTTGQAYCVVALEGVNEPAQMAKVEASLKAQKPVLRATVRSAYEQRSAGFVLKSKSAYEAVAQEVRKQTGVHFRLLEMK